ncbi:hypothetical protein BBJ28_00000937 [Nothophytophthora sp. Chile5]|nr:hypothetical protein BBJ28_00000937 [Nothophytophthora sp. Chile5]
MYSVWTRANAVFFTSLMALAVMCTLTSFSTYLHEPQPVVRQLELHTLHSLRNYRDKADRATLSFDLDAGTARLPLSCSLSALPTHSHALSNCGDSDLSSVFNWNVKQLFVYVLAEFESASNTRNQVVVWDKIVPTKEAARSLKFQDEGVKYFLADQHDQLRGANVTLRLEWDVMPVCGRLFVHSSPDVSSFELPASYQGKAPKGAGRFS